MQELEARELGRRSAVEVRLQRVHQLWIRAKTVDQDERGNAERRALFVGLWPPTIWLIGDSLERQQ